MNDDVARMPVTDAIDKIEDDYLGPLVSELTGNNPATVDLDRLYALAFSRLTKPYLRHVMLGQADGPPYMLGTDQRDMFVPELRSVCAQADPGARILDIGCGDGATTRLLTQSLPRTGSIIGLDANAYYLSTYPKTLLRSGWPGDVTTAHIDLGGTDIHIPDRIDVCLCIHALYFAADLQALLHKILQQLSPNGVAAFVFVDELLSYTGRVVDEYLKAHAPDERETRIASWRERNSLFGIPAQDRSSVDSGWQKAEHHRLNGARVCWRRQPSRIYGTTLGDIVAAAFITTLGREGQPDIEHKIRFVDALLRHHPTTVDLAFELSGPRTNLLSVAQPQTIVVVTKRGCGRASR